MNTLQAARLLTPEERLARRRLILRDALSLLTLFVITSVIFTLTWMLYRSFENHRQELGQRWKARGELALQQGRYKDAIESLRSALAYVPDSGTEIELATALAGAGRTTEATAYFNTLWESAPGDGMINLQLARLAARQGNQANAILHYQWALDGTWEGNGYTRRRQIRLELAGYLLSRGAFGQARTQLMIAASNAPDDPDVKIQIAGLLEQAKDPSDALDIYRSLAARRDPPLAALEGAGRTAFAMGRYRLAAAFLNHEFSGPGASTLPAAESASDRQMLNSSQRILDVYPDVNLPARIRARRILDAQQTAYRRLTACTAGKTPVPAQWAGLVTRWSQLSDHETAAELQQQPDLEHTIVELVYDTETVAAQTCGPPTGDDALLLLIARNPTAVEQE
ncbi:MAG TPA: tetratricopeptide repeat protein [Terracidiphilus sp.]|nr:tetratricopeptide repeat protein [Terracidiphilus sp.]